MSPSPCASPQSAASSPRWFAIDLARVPPGLVRVQSDLLPFNARVQSGFERERTVLDGEGSHTRYCSLRHPFIVGFGSSEAQRTGGGGPPGIFGGKERCVDGLVGAVGQEPSFTQATHSHALQRCSCHTSCTEAPWNCKRNHATWRP